MKTITLRDQKEVLIWKVTKDSDLSKGLEVCYKNLSGIYCNLGIITDVYQQDGVNLYILNTAMGSYMADELKLIKGKTQVQTFKNKNFNPKESRECICIVFAQIGNNTAPPQNSLPQYWTPCETEEINQLKCSQLWIEDNVRYFGYL